MFTICMDRSEIGRNLTYADIRSAEQLHFGSLEHFIPETITWFHIPGYKLVYALLFLRKRFGKVKVGIFAESDAESRPGMELKLVCGTVA